MRPSTLFLATCGPLVLGGLCLTLIHPWLADPRTRADRQARAALVRELRLTDLCLFPETRYARHPSQADLFSAFQDNPGAPDVFPSGSLVRPPLALWREPAAPPAPSSLGGQVGQAGRSEGTPENALAGTAAKAPAGTSAELSELSEGAGKVGRGAFPGEGARP